MKFSAAVALILAAIAPSSPPYHVAEAKLTTSRVRNREGGGTRPSRLLKKEEKKDEKKKEETKKTASLSGGGGKQGKGSLGVCDNCASRLPGFNFWGQSYLEDDFYANFIGPETAFGTLPAAYLKIFDGKPEDYEPTLEEGLELIKEFGICWNYDFLCGCDGEETGDIGIGFGIGGPLPTVGCLLLTLASELIFQSETLRCLLTSLSKTTRDTLCYLADEAGVGNPDRLGQPLQQAAQQEQGGDTGGTRVRRLSESPAAKKIMERRRLNPEDGTMPITGDEMVDFFTLVAEGAAASSRDTTGRKLQGGGPGAGTAAGITTILDMFGITPDILTQALRAKLGCDKNDCSGLEELLTPAPSGAARKLNHEDILDNLFDPEDLEDFIDEDTRVEIKAIASFVDKIAKSDEAYRIGVAALDFGWFDKCLFSFFSVQPVLVPDGPLPEGWEQPIVPPALQQEGPVDPFIACGILYSLEKTEDAIICEDSKRCDIETDCNANQKFETEYTSRRIARALPSDFLGFPYFDGAPNFLVADILAPCSSCGENTCAAFCWYHENFHQCDDYKRAWLYFADGEGTDDLAFFYNVELPALQLALFDIGLQDFF